MGALARERASSHTRLVAEAFTGLVVIVIIVACVGLAIALARLYAVRVPPGVEHYWWGYYWGPRGSRTPRRDDRRSRDPATRGARRR